MRRILVVDDEEIIRDVLYRYLTDQHYTVTTAAGFYDAKACMQNQDFDLLIVDLRLPDGDGVDVIQSFQAQCPGKAILVMTGMLTPEDRLQQVSRWILRDCLHKPFQLSELQDAILRAFSPVHVP
jgi:DNA-binding response OmpR family regulator